MTEEEKGIINQTQGIINQRMHGMSKGSLSDGYHTFNELYEHRITLFIALCRYADFMGKNPWRMAPKDGWFLMGIHTEPGKQITYHLPESKWEETSFARVIEDGKDFIFDGHTGADVLQRLKGL